MTTVSLPADLLEDAADDAVIVLSAAGITATVSGELSRQENPTAKAAEHHARVTFHFAPPGEDACNSDEEVGPFELTFEDGVVALVQESLPLDSGARSTMCSGRFEVCTETWANFDGSISLASVSFEFGQLRGNEQRVVLCHIPPGNPDNAHAITVGASAVDAHFAHGDHLSECEGRDAEEDSDGDDDGVGDGDDNNDDPGGADEDGMDVEEDDGPDDNAEADEGDADDETTEADDLDDDDEDDANDDQIGVAGGSGSPSEDRHGPVPASRRATGSCFAPATRPEAWGSSFGTSIRSSAGRSPIQSRVGSLCSAPTGASAASFETDTSRWRRPRVARPNSSTPCRPASPAPPGSMTGQSSSPARYPMWFIACPPRMRMFRS